MQLSEIVSGLVAAGYPVAFSAFPEGEVPPMPYLLYTINSETVLWNQYYSVQNVTFILRTPKKQTDDEEAVEDFFEYGYLKSEGFDEQNGVYEVSYTLDV